MSKVVNIVFVLLIAMVGVPYSGFALVNAPHFSRGHHQEFNSCSFSNPNAIDTFLTVNDTAVGVTLTWTLIYGALHGTVSSGTSALSTGSLVTPSSLYYTPGSFSGYDSFAFKVSDGVYSDTTYVGIHVIMPPHPGIITGPDSVCVGSSITLLDTPSTGVWSALNAHATITTSGVVVGVHAGMDTFHFTLSNYCGVSQAMHVVSVNPSPGVTAISGPDSMCLDGVITLFESCTSGTWTSSNPLDTIVFGLLRGYQLGLDTVYYTATNAYCTQQASYVVKIGGAPKVSGIAGPSTICLGSTATLSDSLGGGSWATVTGNISVTGTGVITALHVGADTVLYHFANICGIADTSLPVAVLPYPTVLPITGQASYCIGNFAVLYDSTAGGVWSSHNPAVATVNVDGVISAVAAGTVAISYTVSNECGSSTAEYVLTVNRVPALSPLSGSSSVCIGVTDTFTDTAAGGVWSLSNSNAGMTGGLVSGFYPGTDTIKYKLVNMCGADSVSAVFNIVSVPGAGYITGLSAVCPKDTIVLVDTVTGGVWNQADTNLAKICALSGDTVFVVGVSKGIANINYILTNSCGADSAHFSLLVGNDTLCPNAVRQVQAVSQGLSVFPNPSSGDFVLRLNTNSSLTGITFYITNLVGETVFSTQGETNRDLPVSFRLQAGTYFVYASDNLGRRYQKLVVY